MKNLINPKIIISLLSIAFAFLFFFSSKETNDDNISRMKKASKSFNEKDFNTGVYYVYPEKNGLWIKLGYDSIKYFISGINNKYEGEERYLMNIVTQESKIQKAANSDSIYIINGSNRYSYLLY